jgi:hypothetical protein
VHVLLLLSDPLLQPAINPKSLLTPLFNIFYDTLSAKQNQPAIGALGIAL